jgi:hypothetical protein
MFSTNFRYSFSTQAVYYMFFTVPNCKEHVIYSLCGKAIPEICREHVIYSLCGKVIPGTVKNMYYTACVEKLYLEL